MNYLGIESSLESSSDKLNNMVIHVNNAGLSVIAPFFSRYFDMLGMLEDNQFLDQQTAARAVLLLQYIATGQTETEEHFLAMNKLLCGLPLDKHYLVNLRGTTLLTLGFIKQFNHKENGRIIHLTSGQSLGQMPNEIAYAMTKGAIETLTYTLSSEIAKRGITINAVNPGPNDTGWINDELKNELISQFPMKRIGKPKDTAKLIGFLASVDAEWITGQVIHSEGGFKR